MSPAFDQAQLGVTVVGDFIEGVSRATIIAAAVSGFGLDRRSTQGHAIALQIRPAAEASPRSFATPKRWNGRIVAR
jgi:hypothetical protein